MSILKQSFKTKFEFQMTEKSINLNIILYYSLTKSNNKQRDKLIMNLWKSLLTCKKTINTRTKSNILNTKISKSKILRFTYLL